MIVITTAKALIEAKITRHADMLCTKYIRVSIVTAEVPIYRASITVIITLLARIPPIRIVAEMLEAVPKYLGATHPSMAFILGEAKRPKPVPSITIKETMTNQDVSGPI